MQRAHRIGGQIVQQTVAATSRRLEGKVAIITGAGSGIGRATAALFVREGARVICADLTEEVDETVRRIKAEGGSALAMQGDCASDSFNAELVQRALTQWGDLHIFFANAGVSGVHKPFYDTLPEDFKRIFDVNLIGPFLGWKHAATAFLKLNHGGSLIGTSSVAGLRSGAGPLVYSASKAALRNMAELLCNELAGTGIRVNVLCPGLIETGMTKPLFDGARARGSEHKIGQLNPLRRYGHPDEIARAALFLASDDSSYVNGQSLAVCGGLSSSMPIIPTGLKVKPKL